MSRGGLGLARRQEARLWMRGLCESVVPGSRRLRRRRSLVKVSVSSQPLSREGGRVSDVVSVALPARTSEAMSISELNSSQAQPDEL